jgi:cytoskeletal protein CcmA (bactofilin family)
VRERQTASSHPQRRFSDNQRNSATVIGRDTEVEGVLSGAIDLEIWGTLRGDATVKGLVWLRPGSCLTGELDTSDLIIEGELRGEVHATGKVDMRASCRVKADITAAFVTAAEGSRIQGRITVTGGPDGVVTYSERREQ